MGCEVSTFPPHLTCLPFSEQSDAVPTSEGREGRGRSAVRLVLPRRTAQGSPQLSSGSRESRTLTTLQTRKGSQRVDRQKDQFTE